MSQFKLLDEEKSLTIYDMMDGILVICPRCQCCASITPSKNADSSKLTDLSYLAFLQPRRFVCRDCGLVKDWAGTGLGFDWYADPMCDTYFKRPLWLQITYRNHLFWAYNQRHLSLLEKYIQATLRQLPHTFEFGWHNQSLFSRLPKWMVVAKNRKSLLSAIAKLKSEKLHTD